MSDVNLVGITIQDSRFEQSSQTGLQVNDNRLNGMFMIFAVVNSYISRNQQGGMFITTNAVNSRVFIQNTTFERNQLTSSQSAGEAVGLGIYPSCNYSEVNIHNTHFVHN